MITDAMCRTANGHRLRDAASSHSFRPARVQHSAQAYVFHLTYLYISSSHHHLNSSGNDNCKTSKYSLPYTPIIASLWAGVWAGGVTCINKCTYTVQGIRYAYLSFVHTLLALNDFFLHGHLWTSLCQASTCRYHI